MRVMNGLLSLSSLTLTSLCCFSLAEGFNVEEAFGIALFFAVVLGGYFTANCFQCRISISVYVWLFMCGWVCFCVKRASKRVRVSALCVLVFCWFAVARFSENYIAWVDCDGAALSFSLGDFTLFIIWLLWLVSWWRNDACSINY